MKLKFKIIILLISLMVLVVLPRLVLAVNPALDTLDKIGTVDGPYKPVTGDEMPLLGIIGMVINVALGLVGTIFLVLMIYAGYNWMIARGDEEKVTLAKDTIIRAVIGIIIVIGAYAIWNFAFSRLF